MAILCLVCKKKGRWGSLLIIEEFFIITSNRKNFFPTLAGRLSDWLRDDKLLVTMQVGFLKEYNHT
jgi:hypothetical protein